MGMSVAMRLGRLIRLEKILSVIMDLYSTKFSGALMNQLDDFFSEACDLWERGNSLEAASIFHALIAEDHKFSYGNLAVMYESGDGVVKSLEFAAFLYKKSWLLNRQGGDCCNLAALYFYKLHQCKKSFYWWNKAIKIGDGEACLEKAKAMISLGTEHGLSDEIKGLLQKSIASYSITEESRQEAIFLLSDDC